MREQWGSALQSREDTKYKGIGGSGVGNGLRECEVKSINDDRFGDNGGSVVVRGSV